MNATLPRHCVPPDLVIPPRPQAMMVLMEEMPRPEPDFKRVVQAIQVDPGLAGALLKVVNSPAFGLPRKASSISQAVSLLGLRNAHSIAAGLALRHAMNDHGNVSMERFWDTAEKVALICAELARCLRGIRPDEAYTLGLFHDCGIPLLMRRYPHYRDALVRANHGEGQSFTQVEEEAVDTHHGAVGYFVARSWHLPESLCQAILWHHDLGVFAANSNVPEAVKSFIGLVHFAEHIHHMHTRSAEDVEWLRFGERVLGYFGLTDEDYRSLIDAVQDALAAS
ncbi:MAG: HDOD domain-containing protein [Rhodocyclaceae bacterium]|nr:HDOD domain-containing protein [Rhodocyclaceae bacterium]